MAKLYIIALEEHYLDPELKQLGGRVDRIGPPGLIERLDDLGALRLREMDDSGIDFQVLSHSIPGLQNIDAATGVSLARRVNDRLDAAVRAHPTRFAAFAALPTADPRGAADELERTVTKLGFKGAMINGMTRRAVSRRRALLADLRARRRARRADLYPPGDPAPGGGRGLLQRLCRKAPRTVTRRLGL
jgi:predicted TIM-barrel fold metal-dependent hydrolase